MPAVVSRHRLPRRYRLALAGLWLAPVGLLLAALMLGGRVSPALLDPRLLLPLALMLVPAVYVWQQGVDVLDTGIITRVHWPRYYPDRALDAWHFDGHADRRVLTIWGRTGHTTCKVFECRAGHLTDLPALLAALRTRIRPRRCSI